jgi:hypothetical protein
VGETWVVSSEQNSYTKGWKSVAFSTPLQKKLGVKFAFHAKIEGWGSQENHQYEMKLRSGTIVRPGAKPYVPTPSTNIKEFTPQFFKESSEAWRANKIALLNGMYKYKKATPVPVKEEKEIVQVRRSPRLMKQN